MTATVGATGSATVALLAPDVRRVVVVARLTAVQEPLFGPGSRVLVRLGDDVVDRLLVRLLVRLLHLSRAAELSLLGTALLLALASGLSLLLVAGVLSLQALGLPVLLVAGVVLMAAGPLGAGLVAASRVTTGLLGSLTAPLLELLLGARWAALLIARVMLVAARLVALLLTAGLVTLLALTLLLATHGLLVTALVLLATAHRLLLAATHGLAMAAAVLARLLRLLGAPAVVLELVLSGHLRGRGSEIALRLLHLLAGMLLLSLAGLV